MCDHCILFIILELIYSASSLCLAQNRLQRRKLDPRYAVLRVVFDKLLIQDTIPLKLSQLNLQVYVCAEQLVFGALANSHAQGFTGSLRILLSHFESSKHDPDVSEGELLVWEHV